MMKATLTETVPTDWNFVDADPMVVSTDRIVIKNIMLYMKDLYPT